MQNTTIDMAVCRICEKSVAARDLLEHTRHCRVVSSCVGRIEVCNEKLATVFTTIERRKTRLQASSMATPEELDLLDRVGTIASQIVHLDKGPDLEKETDALTTAIRLLISTDPFMKAMINAASQILVDKADALTILGSELTKSADTALFAAPVSTTEMSLPTVDDFVVCKTLSHGSSGEVYLARKKSTREYYALKVSKKRDVIRKNQLSHAMNERRMMALINSPYIVKLYYSFQTVDSLYMVLEYANGGDVYHLLRSVGTLTEPWARFYIAEVVLALEHIHSLGIVHRDIKPDNLLITSNGHIKLADFGLSKDGMQPTKLVPNSEVAYEDRSGPVPSNQNRIPQRVHALQEMRSAKQSLFSYVGTPDYLAPEVILGQGHDTTLDWWTVGACLYEFLVGIPPFFEETVEATYRSILARNIEWPENLSAEARHLIDRLLQSSPGCRLGARGAEEVKSHPFFKGIDWANLAHVSPSFVPPVERITSTDLAMEDPMSSMKQTPLAAPTESGVAQGDEELDPHVESLLADPENFRNYQFKNVSLLADENQKLAEAKASLPTTSITLENETTDKSLTLERRTHCLVAEDNPVTQVLVKALMKQMGISITQAFTGVEAVQHASQCPFDIIFMDIMMPEMDGTEATRIIRSDDKSQNRTTPIIAFTALCDWNTSSFVKDGMNDLLAKPFTKAELYNILKKWLTDTKHHQVKST